MNKKLIITNLLSVTIAITGTIFAIGCADDKNGANNVANNGADSGADTRDAVTEPAYTYKEKVQELATELHSEQRLHQHSEPFSLEIEKVSGQVFTINGVDLPAQSQSDGYKFFKAGDNLYLIKETAEGFEGQVHIIDESQAATEADTEQTVIKAFFKNVSLNDVSYSIDQEDGGQANISVLAVYYNTDADPATLEESFNGNIQLTHDGKTASFQLDDANNSSGLSDLIASHLSPTEVRPIDTPKANFIQDSQSIDPLHLAFDINYYIDDDTAVTKKVEIARLLGATQNNFSGPAYVPTARQVSISPDESEGQAAE